MKVAIISQTDAGGGAGLAAGRLHSGLRRTGFESQMLVSALSSQSDCFTNKLPSGNRTVRIGRRILREVLPKLGLRNLDALESFGWARHPEFASCDIVNYHNLHGDFFSYAALPRLTAAKPAVLTLHDMWAFTGHCIYSFECNRWKDGCGACLYLNTYPEIPRDATRIEWKLKKRAFQRSRLSIIAISRWMEQQVRQSYLRNFPIYNIPNGIDLTIFRPLDRTQCRQLLGLPDNKRLILFAAADVTDRRKGMDLLVQALKAISPALKSKTSLLIMGKSVHFRELELGLDVFEMGYVHDDRLKAQIFSAADVFAFPTRADNLPLVLQESMACGTPLVSFDVGGVADLVRQGQTGFLSAAEDSVGFQRNLERILLDADLRSQLGRSCREIAEKEYDILLQVKRYTEVFANVLECE